MKLQDFLTEMPGQTIKLTTAGLERELDLFEKCRNRSIRFGWGEDDKKHWRHH